MPDNYKDIEKIIGSAQEGNWQAQERLSKESSNLLVQIYRKSSWRPAPDDEAKSIAYLAIGLALRTYKKGYNWWGLLTKIFWSKIIGWHRQNPSFACLEAEEKMEHQVIDSVTPSEIVLIEEEYRQFCQALSELSEDRRICLELTAEGFKDKMIKAHINTDKSVKDLRYHACKGMVGILESKGWKPVVALDRLKRYLQKK